MLHKLRQTLIAAHYPLYQLILAVIGLALCLHILFDCKMGMAFVYSGVTFAANAVGEWLVTVVSRLARRSSLD